MFFFFFSSRRRHTRSLCDWSSDVCSSDLLGFVLLARQDSERGIRMMREVISLKPDFADARYELGKALLQQGDRKSTRLNSSHTVTSYAVFCLKKKTEPRQTATRLPRVAER